MKRVLIVFLILMLTASVVTAAPSSQGPSGEVYVVQANDWLSKIAEKYYGDLFAYSLIVEATNARAAEDGRFAVIKNPDLIEVGQKLWIPIQLNEKLSIPTLETSVPCPITPPQYDFIRSDVGVAGKFPVWRISSGRNYWAKMPVYLPPYEGRGYKTLWYIDEQAQGDLRVIGRQLDGDGIVLFGHQAKQVVDDEGNVLGAIFEEGKEPSDVLLISSAHQTKVLSPSQPASRFIATYSSFPILVAISSPPPLRSILFTL